ncbi:hypothetical protein CEQ21_09135 [Niallia circulans]|uniref:Uncharacterized protein n=1 Tax=Niallia circulans TaxID=1397 RepID=A0A553SFM3_NIACI|nr:hypothetical protein [Niallia circulans]TRZ35787.1 hypothetical protein CEQ21_09135 [Niallia circulans]
MEDEFQSELEENDANENTEEDYYFDFMLGKKVYREKRPERLEQRQERNRGDSWILGNRSRHNNEEAQDKKETSDGVMQYLDQIDMDLVFSNIDLFMSSANELKPLINKVKPMLKKWLD